MHGSGTVTGSSGAGATGAEALGAGGAGCSSATTTTTTKPTATAAKSTTSTTKATGGSAASPTTTTTTQCSSARARQRPHAASRLRRHGASSTGARTAASSGGSSAGGGGAASNGSTIALGNVGTYSGVIGAVFSGAQQTMGVWQAYVNPHGGLNGHPVHVYIEDDGADPSTSVSDVEQEVTQDHVIAFVGNLMPLTVQASVSYLQQQNIPVIGGDASSTTWWQSPILFPQGGVTWDPTKRCSRSRRPPQRATRRWASSTAWRTRPAPTASRA